MVDDSLLEMFKDVPTWPTLYLRPSNQAAGLESLEPELTCAEICDRLHAVFVKVT
jgi:hypothetical protein